MPSAARPVLGFCNGFQIACEAGLLPGALLRNASLRFVCELVRLRVENDRHPVHQPLCRGQLMRIPIAHGDGRYTADAETLDRLEEEGRSSFGMWAAPAMPTSGGVRTARCARIAGIVNAAGNVLGMMPHPERAVDDLLGSSDGIGVFESILSRVAA